MAAKRKRATRKRATRKRATVVTGYSLKQVAKELNVAEATVMRRIETRKVPGVKKRYNVQRHLVFTEADLQKLKAHNNSLRYE